MACFSHFETAPYYGGLYWTRTSDPIDVNDVLYQLSQQTRRRNDVYDNTTVYAICQERFWQNIKIFLPRHALSALPKAGGAM